MTSIDEEFTALSAIYPETSRTPQGIRLDFDSGLFINVIIPPNYPDSKPDVTIRVPWVSSIGAEKAKTSAVSGLTLGRPMLLDLCSALINNLPTPPTEELGPYIPYNPLLLTSDKNLAVRTRSPKPFKRIPQVEEIELSPESNELEGFISGETVCIKKSAFQGHVATVKTLEDVRQKLETIRNHRKVGRATHNIWAFRLSTGEQDFSDDGVRVT